MRRAAADMDIDGLETVMEELKGYRLPDKDEEIFKKLKNACMNFDYDGIEEILENI